METVIIIGVALLLLSRRGQSSQGAAQVNPVSYTQSPNAIIGGALNMGGAMTAPILSSAVNGVSRPLISAFGPNTQTQQSDPVWGSAGKPIIGIDDGGGSSSSGPSGFVGPADYWE
jgi:hypothetical protein